MAQIVINDGDSGLVVRNAINAMFQELYGAVVPPIRRPNTSVNIEVQVNANTYVGKIFMRQNPNSLTQPTVTIGTTGGGNDVFPAAAIGAFAEVDWSEFAGDVENLFFTVTGGSVDITIIQVISLF